MVGEKPRITRKGWTKIKKGLDMFIQIEDLVKLSYKDDPFIKDDLKKTYPTYADLEQFYETVKRFRKDIEEY